MDLPVQTQKLIIKALQEIRQSASHTLSAEMRFNIYQSFGESRVRKVVSPAGFYLPDGFSVADNVFNWLCVITARKVIPIWRQAGIGDYEDESYCRNPVKWLESAEELLLGKSSFDEDFIDTYTKYANGLSELEEYTVENVYHALYSSFCVLQIFLLEFDEELSVRLTNPKNDLASYAIKAYAGIDTNEPGLWVYVTACPEDYEDYESLKYLPDKELEFWEWWLTEAIPEAWELASKHS